MRGIGRIGDPGGIEARALVANLDLHQIGRQAAGNVDLFGGVGAVAMFDRVGQRLFHGQVNAEDIVVKPTLLLELVEDLFEHTATCPRTAGNHMVTLPDPTTFGH